MDKSLIWVLADDRPGNNSQAIGLAEALQRPYEIKKIAYNSFSKLPNFLKFSKLIGIDKSSIAEVLNQTPPKIIISAGRKTAALALFLKNYYPGIFIIHIMKPGYNINKFDLVILPKHDGLGAPNVLTSIGALNRVNEEILDENYKKFPELDLIKSPKIALLIGGSSKQGKFDKNSATQLVKICAGIAKNMKANLLVTTSKRTDKIVIDELESGLKEYSSFFYKWHPDSPNPYFALLKAADYIIVTGDSMSMCSESCSTGKPVYIYNPKTICSEKHLRLHSNLFACGYASQLTSTTRELKVTGAKKLNETLRISKEVNKLLVANIKA
jgi:mitochondrial fission protein ELM1